MKRAREGCCRGYKVILMDINMPLMGGVEATRILRQKADLGEIPRTKVVALSAEPLKINEEEYYLKDVGFASYITKPIKRDEFLELMRSYGAI